MVIVNPYKHILEFLLPRFNHLFYNLSLPSYLLM